MKVTTLSRTSGLSVCFFTKCPRCSHHSTRSRYTNWLNELLLASIYQCQVITLKMLAILSRWCFSGTLRNALQYISCFRFLASKCALLDSLRLKCSKKNSLILFSTIKMCLKNLGKHKPPRRLQRSARKRKSKNNCVPHNYKSKWINYRSGTNRRSHIWTCIKTLSSSITNTTSMSRVWRMKTSKHRRQLVNRLMTMKTKKSKNLVLKASTLIVTRFHLMLVWSHRR